VLVKQVGFPSIGLLYLPKSIKGLLFIGVTSAASKRLNHSHVAAASLIDARLPSKA
jgi:hypothetical protein